MTTGDSTMTRYRPKNHPEWRGKTREECIDGWTQEPGLDRFWAESKFNQLVQSGHLVEINDG